MFAPKRTFPDSCCHSHSCPCGHPLLTHESTGGQSLASSFGSVSCGVTAPFLWILVQPRFSLCLPSLESLFPPFLWKSCNQILLGFKVRFHVDNQSLCYVPRLGSLMWSSEPSQQWENFFGIIGLHFWSPTWQVRDFILLWLCPSAICPECLTVASYLWTWGIFFWKVLASFCWLLFSS